jgi:hypothetical protein
MYALLFALHAPLLAAAAADDIKRALLQLLHQHWRCNCCAADEAATGRTTV